MKTLWLMRHAKSSWKDAGLADHDRPLNRRGSQASTTMGNWFKHHQPQPERILCSTAVRARQTCERLLQEWIASLEPRYLAELYHCPAAGMVDVLRRIPEITNCALLIGHNPGLADFLQIVAGFEDKFPTAAVAELAVDVSSWQDVTLESPIKLRRVLRPRDLD